MVEACDEIRRRPPLCHFQGLFFAKVSHFHYLYKLPIRHKTNIMTDNRKLRGLDTIELSGLR
jgi:hypothetical protein